MGGGFGERANLRLLKLFGGGRVSERAKFFNLEVIGCPAKFSFNSVGYIY